MATKKNAVPLAVPVQPSKESITLPTWQQTMLTALAVAQDSLERLSGAIATDKDWGGSDVEADVSYSMDLVLERIKGMRANLPTEVAAFDREWYTAASVVNLCVRAFSRTDTYYFRCLETVQKLFEVFGDAVEFMGARKRSHGN